MERKLPKIRTSSPRSSGERTLAVSPSGLKNDSFLEDLELLSDDPKVDSLSHQTDRHVTTRRTISPSVIPVIEATDEFENLIRQRIEKNPALKVTFPSDRKESGANKPVSRECKTMEMARDGAMTTVKELKMKLQENKIKTQESTMKTQEHKVKMSDTKSRTEESRSNAKNRSRRSDSSKESSRCSDASSKENSRPLDSSKDNNRQPETSKDRNRHSDVKKLDSKEAPETVVLLTAIKELVSTYTKQESAKILRTVQDLHINSQANLIKSLIFQTDDLKRELHPGGDSIRLKTLMEENEKLRESYAFLKMKNNELQRIADETERIKEENFQLKQKCKDLLSQKFS